LPPDELFTTVDPMQWLIKKLKKQQEYININNFSIFRKFSLCCNNNKNHSLHHQIHNISVDENFYHASKDFLELSNGASAIIRIVDSRLKNFISEPIAIDNEKKIKTNYLEQILKIISSHHIKNKKLKNDNIKKKKKRRKSIIERKKKPNLDENFVLIESRYKSFLASFAYSSSKYKETRTIQESIPPTIEAQALIKEINQKFLQTISS
jgi:hypothetical protein